MGSDPEALARQTDSPHTGAMASTDQPCRPSRFVVRGAADEHRVVDIWTGETAVIAMTPQDGLSAADADHVAQLLNRRAAGGDRTIRQ